MIVHLAVDWKYRSDFDFLDFVDIVELDFDPVDFGRGCTVVVLEYLLRLDRKTERFLLEHIDSVLKVR